MSTLLLSAFSVTLLSLVWFVAKRQRLLKLERYLGDRQYRKLIKPVRAINRALTPREKMEREHKFIRDWIRTQREIDGVLQREIYLLEEEENLNAARRNGVSLDEQAALMSKIEGDLGQIRPRLWKNAQDLIKMDSRRDLGSWTLEFFQSPGEQWKREGIDCNSGLGCCARNCGCCEEGQRSHAEQSVRYDVATHCTIECGCCIRWRGFRRLEDCK